MPNLTFIKTQILEAKLLEDILKLYDVFTGLNYNVSMVLLEADQEQFIPKIPIFSGLELIEIKNTIVALDDNAFERMKICDTPDKFYYPLDNSLSFAGGIPIHAMDDLVLAVRQAND